ncbi:hypothetical protein P9112_014036 [Eukaryota sp. TZLM1-RC]
MFNLRGSSIAIELTSLGSKNTYEPGRTDLRPVQNISSSSRTPQSGRQYPSSTGTERSYASPPATLTRLSGDTFTQFSSTSSSSQTPQLRTEPPSAVEKSITSSHQRSQDTTPSLDVPVVPINLHLLLDKELVFLPLSFLPPGSEEKR